MVTNNVTVSEELEDVIRHYEEEGQTVVLASIGGKNVEVSLPSKLLK